jgi:hypothetical protein
MSHRLSRHRSDREREIVQADRVADATDARRAAAEACAATAAEVAAMLAEEREPDDLANGENVIGLRDRLRR